MRNYELHNLHSPTNIVAKMIRRLVTRGEDGSCLQCSRTTDGETPLGGEKLMFENIIKTDLKDTGCKEAY